MLPKEAIETLIAELNGRIPPPVHTSGIQESRPIPSVLIENINLEDENYHNTDFAGASVNESGYETEHIYHHYYNLRVTLSVKDNDEVDAYIILGDLKKAIDEIGRDAPNRFHPDVTDIRSLSSGPVNYQYHEPMETELSQSLLIETFYESVESDLDVIETLEEDFEFY